MKRLIIMRHGKSNWAQHGLSDFDRTLKPRGIRDATAVGQQLTKLVDRPDLLISSSAIRARTTAAIVAEQINYAEADLKLEPKLYGADLHDIFDIVKNIDDHIQSVFLFGHNPTFTTLVNHLQSEFLPNLPTSGCFGFDLKIETWDNVAKAKATKIFHLIPKEF